MARMVCKQGGLSTAAEPQSAAEVPAFEDWSAATSADAGAGVAPHPLATLSASGESGASDEGSWFQSSRELSAGLGFSEGPWSDGPFGDAGQGGV
ncbi:MAG: hypothetical protein RJA98_278 [Pseudomonadota bacterium]|jgi:hypothetical protein